MQVNKKYLTDLHTGRPLTKSDYTISCPLEDEQSCLKHVEDSNKHIREEIVLSWSLTGIIRRCTVKKIKKKKNSGSSLKHVLLL